MKNLRLLTQRKGWSKVPDRHSSNMLVITLVIGLVSPFAAFTVNADTLPKIKAFQFVFVDSAYDRGKRLELTCQAEGLPQPTVEFQFDGYSLRNTSDERISHETNKLSIKNVSYTTDEGLYRCVARNRFGMTFAEKFIKIGAMGEFLDRRNGTPNWEQVTIGLPHEILCPKHTYTYPRSYRWGTDRPFPKHLQEDKQKMVLSDGALFFPVVTPQLIEEINREFPRGISCILHSGDEHAYSKSFLLHSREVYTNDLRPKIASSSRLPAIIYMKEGESRTLICAAGGLPAPTVAWSLNGIQISNEDSDFEINIYQPQKLTIKSASKRLEGEYACAYSNRVGSDETKGRLVISEPARLLRQLSATKVAHGTPLRLACDASGTEPIDHQWYKNGKRLSSYVGANSTTTINGSVLTMSNVSFDDQATYQCLVKNEFGSDTSAAVVSVTEPRTTQEKREGGSEVEEKTTKPLATKYIIIIACCSCAFIVLVLAVVYVYCRLQDSSRDVVFVDSERARKDSWRGKDEFPPPPSDDDDDVAARPPDASAILMNDLRAKIESESSKRKSPPPHKGGQNGFLAAGHRRENGDA